MQEINANLSDLRYPALIFRKEYVFLADTPLELCVHPRSIFRDTIEKTKSGELQMIDSDGRFFKIVDWKTVPVFGGLKGIFLNLFGSIFAEPVLLEICKLDLDEMKEKLKRAIRSRLRYDSDKKLSHQFIRDMAIADSPLDAMIVVSRTVSRLG